jgi:hypothetical protein
MSTKQPILTKRCDFEHKARSAKHKAQSMSTKQRQKNWAQLILFGKGCPSITESFPLVGFLVLCATVAALPVVQPHCDVHAAFYANRMLTMFNFPLLESSRLP